MNKTHIEVSDVIAFQKKIEEMGGEKRQSEKMWEHLYGLNVFINMVVPANEAWLVKDGKVVQRYTFTPSWPISEK